MAESHDHHKEPSPKDAVIVGSFLVFIFLLTVVAHILYVKGYAYDMVVGMQQQETTKQTISIFGTKEECEKVSGGKCTMHMCDKMSQSEFEDICGQGFKEVWKPRQKKD